MYGSMDGITLFELPVYTMSEEEFNKRWEKKKVELYNEFISHGHTEDSARQGVRHAFYPKWIWKYNQIIGYIKISVTADDVLFDLFCSMDQRYYIDSKRKHFIEDWRLGGTHFYVANKSEDYIKQEIISWLGYMEKDHLRGRFHVDYTTFNNIFNYVPIKEIMKSLNKSIQ